MLDHSPPGAESQGGEGVTTGSATALAVLVVGMHRSGTSALSGVLNKLGVAVPEDLLPANEQNAKGYFEATRIVDFHDALLVELGTSWDDPLPIAYDWLRSPTGAAAIAELAQIVEEESAGAPMCLFKDPRICRLLPLWRAAVRDSGRGAVAVLPYRHPLEVAGSLQGPHGFSRAYSLYLWLEHVLLAERHSRDLVRSFVAYDALMADWREVIGKLQRDLDLALPRDLQRGGPDVDAFLSGELRHHAAAPGAFNPDDPLSALCGRTWVGLQRFNADPDDAEAMAIFDGVWRDLEQAIEVLGPLVIDYQRTSATAKATLQANLEEAHAAALERYAHEQRRQAFENAASAKLAELDERLRHRDLRIARLRHEGDLARQDADWARHEARAQAEARLAREAQAEDMRREIARLQQIELSTFWGMSYPLRRLLAKMAWLRGPGRTALQLGWWAVTFKLGRKLREQAARVVEDAAVPVEPAAVPTPETSPEPPAPLELPARLRDPARRRALNAHILFVSGEAETPGHLYRVQRWAQAAERAGATTSTLHAHEMARNLHEVARADMVFIWRAVWDHNTEALIAAAREAEAPVVFDVDDLLFEPDLAKVGIIDGIRSQGFEEADVALHFDRARLLIRQVDVCTAPTPFLAQRLRAYKPSFVLPNGFDEDVLQRSRMAVRRRRAEPSDGLIRLGYAGGSKTHQADFAQCAEGLAEVLRAYPQTRLVLFEAGFVPLLDMHEYPALAGLEDRFEWRKVVPIQDLPGEVARFDINLAPLEVGNPFCEAKSELKFFEAALAGVPTVASPTEPFRLAIQDGETGFLAADPQGWRTALSRLVEDAALRKAVADAALIQALARFGPEPRVEAFLSLADQVMADPRRAARAFELELSRRDRPAPRAPQVPAHAVLFEADQLRPSAVTVVVPLHDYAHFVVEALDSVRHQSLADLDLIVVDDASSDDSLAVARDWIETHAARFNRVLLIRNIDNAGLAFTRNIGFANAETAFVFPLDADNRLRPACLEEALAAIERAYAAFAYPRIRQFGDDVAEMGYRPWHAAGLIDANYIDAMVMVRRSAWAAVGGYDHVRHGWEDYDFWCRLVELGMFGVPAPQALAEYRIHPGSMLRTETEVRANMVELMDEMERRHPWLRLERIGLAAAPPADGVADPGHEPA